MTAIVYRDGILAADTAIWLSSTICGHQRKIGRSADGRILLGAGGDPAAVEWFLTNRNPELVAGDLPKVSDQGFSAIVVYSLTEVVLIDDRANRTRLRAPYFVIGRGSEFMFGALAAGATAEQAVMLAVEHTDGAAGEVNVERLFPDLPPTGDLETDVGKKWARP